MSDLNVAGLTSRKSLGLTVVDPSIFMRPMAESTNQRHWLNINHILHVIDRESLKTRDIFLTDACSSSLKNCCGRNNA